MEETTVKKINTVSVNSKTFSGRAVVYQCTTYQCTTCQSRFIDMYDSYFLCPFCGRKIIGVE